MLAVALCIRGVQEFEGNYSVGVTNFQTEHELQNYAENALIRSIENGKKKFSFTSKRLGKVKAEVYNQKVNFRLFERHYYSGGVAEVALKDLDDNDLAYENCTVYISVASCDSDFIGGKVYRRALAYVIEGDKTLHFLTDL